MVEARLLAGRTLDQDELPRGFGDGEVRVARAPPAGSVPTSFGPTGRRLRRLLPGARDRPLRNAQAAGLAKIFKALVYYWVHPGTLDRLSAFVVTARTAEATA